MSLSGIRAKFAKQVGSTIGEYRDKLRITVAQEMLESRFFAIADLAAELGYCDIDHFSKVFKAHLGYPPSKHMHK